MAVDNRLIRDLHRLFLNGKLREVKRGEGGCVPTATPLSAQWLSLGESFPRNAADWEQAKAWQSILTGISRVASIIYGPRRMQIIFDRYDENYQYKPQQSVIVVSTEPALAPPPGFSIYDAVDAMTGQVIHEAAHIRERQSEASALPFPDDPIKSLLHHLTEDAVIDQIISLEYPGFEGYLLAYRNYYIDWKLRNNWGFRSEGRLKQLILAMRTTKPDRISRWSVRHAYLYLLYRLTNARSVPELRKIDRVEVAERLYAILYDARHAEHWSEPDVLSESFVLGKDGPAVQGEKGNNRGGNEWKPVTREALTQWDVYEIESPWPNDGHSPAASEGKPVEKVRSKAPKWADEFQHEKGNRRKFQGLSDEIQIMLHLLTEEDRQRIGGTESGYETQLARIPLHAQAARRYQSAVDAVKPQIALLQSTLAGRPAQGSREQFALRSGSDLDEESLYRAKFAADLFKRSSPHAHRTIPINLILLIDASYSMIEPLEGADIPKYAVAQRIAALFVEALEPMDDMRAWVYSYSSLGRKVEIRDLYSPDGKADKSRIGDLYPAHQTPEYQALLAVSRLTRQAAGTGVKKIYLVLSDGCPSDDLFSRTLQIAEIAKLTRRLEAAGDTVIHIAMGPHGAAEAMYSHRLSFSTGGYAAMIRRFGKLLERLLVP